MASGLPEEFLKLVKERAKHLSDSEIQEFGKLLKDKLMELKELLDSCEVENAKLNIEKIRKIKDEIDDIMTDKNVCRLFSVLSAQCSFLGLFALTNPAMIAIVGGGAVAGLALHFFSDHLSGKIRKKLRNINDMMERDHRQFRRVAPTIVELNEMLQNYFKCSLYDTETVAFLISSATYVFTKCENSPQSKIEMTNLLKQLAVAEAMGKFHDAIEGTLTVTSASALFPILNISLQSILFIQSVEEDGQTMMNIYAELDRLQKEYNALKLLH